jgi:hypothetical protein
MAFMCVSQPGEFKNTIVFFGGNPCQKLLAEKVERKKTFFLSSFPSIFFNRVFGCSLHEEPKNTIKISSKIRPENLKKSQRK